MKTFWRLLGFLRPYRRAVIASFALAAVAMGTGTLIPFLVGRTVDDIRRGQTNLWPLALAIVGAGLIRLSFSVARRLMAGRVSLGVEYDLRNRMYSHLQSLELAFFDTQQTGQLMSRATVDLQAVRFFLGYGLIFMAQSAVTILIAAVVMITVNPGLAAVALSPTPFVFWAAFRYGRQNRPASQEVQQRIAELTAEVEENVSGIRLVKAFAREERQLARVRRSGARVFQVLDRKPEMTSPPGAPPLPAGDGRVELEGVAFSYGDGMPEVLHDIDLTVEQGQTVAIVGATGSGKTTLVSLLPRLYDVTAGRELVDGMDM